MTQAGTRRQQGAHDASDAHAGGVGAVVMAAGAGRRMGGLPKALMEQGGATLLERTVTLLAQAGAAHVVVVLGHHGARIAAVLQRLPPPAGAHLAWVHNPAPDDGPASSLRCALAALPPGLGAVLVALGDQPLLQAQDARALLAAWRARPAGVELVLPRHDGHMGHPVVFGDALRQVVQRTGQGVRAWRSAHSQQVQALDVPHARCTTDIDALQDLQRLRAEHGVALTLPGSADG